MTSAVIYARFSPRRRADECTSNETQEQLCREYAERQGWEVCGVFADEGVSGDTPIAQRPGLTAAIAALRAGDVLLVWRRDRLARDLVVDLDAEEEVKRRKARLVSVEGDPTKGANTATARFVRRMLAVTAAYEKELAAERTSLTHLAKQRRGKRVGRRAPYGTRLDPDDPTRLVPDPVEIEAVHLAMALREEGLSNYRIAKRLDEEYPHACRAPSGKWDPKTVGAMIDRGVVLREE